MELPKIFYWIFFPFLLLRVWAKDLFSRDRMGFFFCLSIVLSYIRYRTEPLVDPQERRMRKVLGDEKYNTYFKEKLTDEHVDNSEKTKNQ